MDPRTEVDIWTRHFERRKLELTREGMTPEQADDEASAEIRREIRGERQSCRKPPLHYQIEPLPDGGVAIWRTSNDGTKVYSVTEMPAAAKPEPPPEPSDQLVMLLQAMAETNDD
jgi:hypothetical protein